MAPRVGKLNISEAIEQYAADAAEGVGTQFYKLHEGVNNIRILPPAPGRTKASRRRMTHWHIGDDDRVFNCPRSDDKSADCVICTAAKVLFDAGDAESKELGREIKAQKKFLYNIVDLDHIDAGVQVVEVPKVVHIAIGSLVADSDYGDITDLQEGYNLKVTKTQGKGKYKVTYETRARKNASPIPDEIAEWLEDNDLPDLDALVTFESQDKMRAALEGLDDDEPDEEEEEAPKPSARAARVQPPVVANDDDDDDDDEPTVTARPSVGQRLNSRRRS